MEISKAYEYLDSLDYSACLECGSKNNIIAHHIIPQSLGGKKVVPLCETCHALVHEQAKVNLRTLTKKGLEKARANGKRWGRAPFGYTQGKGCWIINDEQIEILRWIKERKDKGMSYGAIARALNEMEIPTSQGGNWTRFTIIYLLKRKNFPYVD